ncbi:MAG TPA: hypothetical protein VGJ20_39290 [Xanthobacteraceae bacterium]
MRIFTRYLIAICIGIAGTVAWQSYGGAAKEIIGRKAPDLGWSPESKQMIASWVQQLGWTEPTAGREDRAVPAPATDAQTTANAVAPPAPATSLLDLQQHVQQIADGLTAVRQSVEQFGANQDQMAREITSLQATDQEILAKISAPLPRSSDATVARKQTPKPSSQRAPIPLH